MSLFKHAATAALAGALVTAPMAQAQSGDNQLFLPGVQRSYNPNARPPGPVVGRAVNVPYIPGLLGGNGGIAKLPEMALFWYGEVRGDSNYSDVRIASADTSLVVYVASFDRANWYDTTPSAADLTQWDSVTIYLDTAGQAGGLSGSTYRFTAQLNNGGAVSDAGKLVQRGVGGAWTTVNVPFTANAAWRGGRVNDNTFDRGFVIWFNIPYASLGLSGRPADGSAPWALASVTHDRDNGGPVGDSAWPDGFTPTSPTRWGVLRWGLPGYTPAPSQPGGSVTLRHKLNGLVVQDADVGGVAANQCSGDENFIWNGWGDTNYGSDPNLNVQNQSDVADWPCFSRTYLSFPLDQVPAGKIIRRATLTLYQFGGSGTASNGQPGADAYIQVFSLSEGFSEGDITWNNAPLPAENWGGTWVGQVVGCGAAGGIAWPCIPRTWDVSGLVAQANAAGQPARMALYSGDSDYSTGKYFTSSQVNDWNAAGRPTLVVEWGNP
jgi:hypothetical protein